MKLALAAAAIIATAACTVKKADEGPDLFGPSDFALALDLFATPDSITQDGASPERVVDDLTLRTHADEGTRLAWGRRARHVR